MTCRFDRGDTVSRREVLEKLSWIVVAVASGQTLSSCSEEKQAESDPVGLASLLADASNAAAVGAWFLMTHPEENDINTLVFRLGLEIDSLPPRKSAALEIAAQAIHIRHVEDFREARLFNFGGWMLSGTELRLAAITHLAKNGE
jgi:hypothetical protein